MAIHDPHITRQRAAKTAAPKSDRADQIVELTFGKGLARPRRAELDHERKAALFDLLENNLFVHEGERGPYHLSLSCEEGRLIFSTQSGASVSLSLAPLSRLVRDYFLICESYYDAIQSAPLQRVEQLDQTRRQLHDEGAQMLKQSLGKKTSGGTIHTDINTARRLFTLICVMYMK